MKLSIILESKAKWNVPISNKNIHSGEINVTLYCYTGYSGG